MRCFVAAFVEAAAARRLRDAYRVCAAADPDTRTRPAPVREVPLCNYHVTLAFLGEVSEEQLPGLLSLVESLTPAPTTLSVPVLGFVGLPHGRRARLLAAMLADEVTLSHWAAALAAARVNADGARGSTFRPHVTLARFRRARALAPLALPALLAPLTVTLQAPALYRSETLPEGARYTRLTQRSVSRRRCP